jgi:hypothetical protein
MVMDAEPIAVRRRKREFAGVYSKWQTEQLQKALGPDRGRYEPLALSVMLQELEKRQCPACGLARHAESPRCDCGHEYMPPPPPDDPEVAADPVAEFSARLSEAVGGEHFQASRSIESNVLLALVAGCVSLVVAVLWSSWVILIPSAIAIGAGLRLKSLLALHRDYLGVPSARRRTRIGQILAWIAVGLYLLSWTGVQCSILG